LTAAVVCASAGVPETVDDGLLLDGGADVVAVADVVVLFADFDDFDDEHAVRLIADKIVATEAVARSPTLCMCSPPDSRAFHMTSGRYGDPRRTDKGR
jgi:hypothetical protein